MTHALSCARGDEPSDRGAASSRRAEDGELLRFEVDETPHGMRLDHPIFAGPLVPNLQLETRPGSTLDAGDLTPELPETVDTWRVQSGLGHTGALATPWGFGDSPDTEWIASGPNAVSPIAVALGRHGNVFLWGFSAAPDRMTAAAMESQMSVQSI